ncbi:MAG: hypothetical protein GF353_09790 [Candidatus Lokiarchaeota archaeon]|nr:hypothetical protein [Candidatus Lokiarchaeota archaeon]
MSMKKILESLRKADKEFTTSEEIKKYSKKLRYPYNNVINYLSSQGFILKIFQGLYYVKSEEEIQSEKIKYSLLELVARAVEMKRIKDWYYGLYTALTLNGKEIPEKNEDMYKKNTFYIISDRFAKRKPIKILNYEFVFIKIKYNLATFGIIDKVIRYSDLEKTILDFIYLWNYSGMHTTKIRVKISNYMYKAIDKDKIIEYSRNYSNLVQNILNEVVNEI